MLLGMSTTLLWGRTLQCAAWCTGACSNAPSFPPQILKILSGKVVVGHAVHNDFKALKYSHPKELTRDTSKIPLLNQKGGFPENVAISLKRLAKELLHKDIQVCCWLSFSLLVSAAATGGCCEATSGARNSPVSPKSMGNKQAV